MKNDRNTQGKFQKSGSNICNFGKILKFPKFEKNAEISKAKNYLTIRDLILLYFCSIEHVSMKKYSVLCGRIIQCWAEVLIIEILQVVVLRFEQILEDIPDLNKDFSSLPLRLS